LVTTSPFSLQINRPVFMLEQYVYKGKEPLKLIGDLIPRDKVTLLHGRSGCGKTFSILKFFIEHGIEPVLLDFDDNEIIDGALHIDGDMFIRGIKGNDALQMELDKKVVIIDTYAMAALSLKKHLDITVEQFVASLDATVVVIAHTVYYSGKPAEPAVPFEFANHVACRLHLHNDVKMTKVNDYLEVEKLRGKGSYNIVDWMR